MKQLVPDIIKDGESTIIDFTACELPPASLEIIHALQKIDLAAAEAQELIAESLDQIAEQFEEIALGVSEKIADLTKATYAASTAALAPMLPGIDSHDGYRLPWISRCRCGELMDTYDGNHNRQLACPSCFARFRRTTSTR